MTSADLFAAYQAAKAAWNVFDEAGDMPCSGPEWDAFLEAEKAFFESPCLTIDDVRAKAGIIMNDDGLFDTLTSSYVGEEHCAAVFLQSLIGIGGES